MELVAQAQTATLLLMPFTLAELISLHIHNHTHTRIHLCNLFEGPTPLWRFHHTCVFTYFGSLGLFRALLEHRLCLMENSLLIFIFVFPLTQCVSHSIGYNFP